MSPVRFGGGSSSDSLPSGSGDFKFNEDANVDDRFGPVVALLDRAQVDDALGLISPQFAEDANVDDPWRLNDLRARWNEDANVDDLAAFVPQLPEDATVEDVLGLLRPNLNDDVSIDDLMGLRANLNEDANVDDLAAFRFTNITYGRSGTPDSDGSGDAWVDKASQTTNHGNESLQVNGEVLNTEKRGLAFFDFTRFANLTALAGGSHSFRIRASHDAATGANNLRVRMSTLAAKPFVESTVTWDTPLADGGGPAEGTLRVNTTVAVAAGAAAAYTVILTDAEVNNLLGNWVYVRLLSEATLAATIFTVSSRDDATLANRPTFALTLKR